MKLRNAVLIAGLSALIAVPATAFAAPKQGDGQEAHGDSGQHNGSDNGNAKGGPGGGNSGQGKGNGPQAPAPKTPDPPPRPSAAPALPVTDPDAEQIRVQVESDGAMSLDEVLKTVGRISRGRMLEIKPFKVGATLVYDVTVLEQGGVVRHVLLDAKTGRQVRIVR